ncbi:MAG: enoyl-CoA hydratase [Acetobacteraceae bacterium]|nr:enoyl-CoA hydratase [Acetobacteraceae bacterium]MSP29911.1 enoyl-CoA hydratase [Acetobacteraceae bacterium]
MTENIVITCAVGVLEIRLNRPDKKNALTQDMYAALSDALEASNIDPAVRAIILTGTGDAFTSGNDVRDFQARAATNTESPAGRFLPAISSLKKPLIAAVNGAAIGIGTTMLMHADLIVAARSARFLMPFTALGLVPEAGSSMLVPQAIGLRRANAMLLLGDGIDASTAADWGFVNQVVDDADLMPTAHALATRLAALPPEAVRQTKALIRHGAPDLPTRMADELKIFAQRVASPEAGEAFAAFVEKRKPDFSRFS